MRFLLALTLLAALGCKRAKEEKADLGPEAKGTEIDDALSHVLDGRAAPAFTPGQYASYSILRRLENSENTIVLGGVTAGVHVAADQASKYLLIEKSYRQADGTFVTDTSEVPLGSVGVSLAGALNAQALRTQGLEMRARAAQQPTKVTFHKLSVSDGVMPAPARLAARPDCGGLAPCELPVHYVRFTMVVWYGDTDYQKVNLDFAFSSATPWLPFGKEFEKLTGVMVADCRSTYVPVEGRTVYLRDCQQLEDVQK